MFGHAAARRRRTANSRSLSRFGREGLGVAVETYSNPAHEAAVPVVGLLLMRESHKFVVAE